jgi:hypothetical protein
MASGSYDRLLAWSKKSSNALRVSSSVVNDKKWWFLGTTIKQPVEYSASGKGASIDAAAREVIDDLTTVGVIIE